MSLPTMPEVASLHPRNMNNCSVSGGSDDQENAGSEESSTEEEKKWLDRYKELKRYRTEHKNCNVPRSYGKLLKVWVDKQRRDYGLLMRGRASSMTLERIQKLESIGFEWCGDDDETLRVMWDNEDNFRERIERFQELQCYKAKHGHCNVPTKSGVLGRWVGYQRNQYRYLKDGKRSQITDERVQKLELIGFQWSIRGLKNGYTSWDERFQELQSYEVKHGNLTVPKRSGVLGRWVHNQRQQYRLLKEGKPSKITDERVQKLEAIGFQWRSLMKRPCYISTVQPLSTASDAPLVGESGRCVRLLLNNFHCLSSIGICIIYHISYGSSWLVHFCDNNINR